MGGIIGTGMIRTRNSHANDGRATIATEAVEVELIFQGGLLPQRKQVLEARMSFCAYLTSFDGDSTPCWDVFDGDKSQTLAFHGSNLPIQVTSAVERKSLPLHSGGHTSACDLDLVVRGLPHQFRLYQGQHPSPWFGTPWNNRLDVDISHRV